MAAVHWSVSQSLFIVSINHYDAQGNLESGSNDMARYDLERYDMGPYDIGPNDMGRNMDLTLEWSQAGLVLSIALGTCLVLFLVATGFRRYPLGIPVAGSSSLAISAACKRQSNHGQDIVLYALKYGKFQNMDAASTGEPFAGFSSEDVAPLSHGDYWPPSWQDSNTEHAIKHEKQRLRSTSAVNNFPHLGAHAEHQVRGVTW